MMQSSTIFAFCSVLVFLCVANLAEAHPENQGKIPNGFSVPCIAGNPGCSSGQPFCLGVGHLNCAGGGDRNVFGQAFGSAGSLWTRDLCTADSDGDGLTNGEELGDPCCTWTAGTPLADWQKSYEVSHPGFNTSVSLHPRLRATWCSKAPSAGPGPAPAPTAPQSAGSFYNPGERQVQIDFLIDEFHIPPEETNYYDFYFNFNVDQDMDIVGIMPIIGTPDVVHHFVVSLCSAETPAPGVGSASEQTPPPGCFDTVYAWAPGRGNLTVPSNTGFRIGNGTLGLVMNIHYNNPQLWSNYTDLSGLRIFLTPDLREYRSGVLWTGAGDESVGDIPPGEPAWFSTVECRMAIDEDIAPSGLQVFSFQPHAHYLGRRVWSDQVRSQWSTDALGRRIANKTKVGEMGRDDRYDYNVQAQLAFQPFQVIRDGDIITTTCVYDSTFRNYTTHGGAATMDEMCINFFTFYPREAVVDLFCQSTVSWSGRMPASVTSALQLIPATTRPEWDWALEVADGSLQCDRRRLPDAPDFEAEFLDACGLLTAVTLTPYDDPASGNASSASAPASSAHWSITLDAALQGSRNYTAGRDAVLQLSGLPAAPSCSRACASFVYNLAACAQTPELKLDLFVQAVASLIPVLDPFCAETAYSALMGAALSAE